MSILFTIVSAVAWFSLLSGCALRLAPEYSASIVDGLEGVNRDVMVFFAAVETGTSAGTFGARRDAYADLIGRVDALRLTAIARPAPTSGGLGLGVIPRSVEEIDVLDTPTPAVLETMIASLQAMRNRDQASGLPALVIQGYKREVEISMDQALTYEKALQR
jgi:hypothetical protein